MRPITEIIIHATATKPDFMARATSAQRVAEIRRWHVQERKWKDIGYHYLIDRDGTVMNGRPVEQIGAHVQGHNTGTIGISLFGGDGSNEKDQFGQHFTPEQDTALRRLIGGLIERFPTVTKISGHNQYAAKACPGFNAPQWYAIKPAKESPAPTNPAAPSWMASIIAAIIAIFGGKK